MNDMGKLERLLVALRSNRGGARGPRLVQRRRTRMGDAVVLVSVGPGDDPLTGLRHRAEGASLVAEVGPVTLVAHLQHEDDGGLVLRGQLAPASLAQGGIVHVRGGVGEAAMGAIAEDGAFGVVGLRDAPADLVVELEDGCWQLPWPRGAESLE